MSREVAFGNPPIAVDLRRSARAKRLSLRVSRLDGKVTLTLPPRAPEREAMAFLYAREGWLRKHIDDIAPDVPVRIGGHLPFRGQALAITAADVKRATLRDGALLVPDDPALVGRRVQAFVKLQARDALAAASDHYASYVGRSYNRLSLRDTRSRWGSCSSKGVLMYSWRLIMAPPDVLNYVAAHEVAHLVEMNHSAAFWNVVAELMPDYDVHRRWLRQEGQMLHRITFGD